MNQQAAGIAPALTGMMGQLVKVRLVDFVFRDDSKNSTHIFYLPVNGCIEHPVQNRS